MTLGVIFIRDASFDTGNIDGISSKYVQLFRDRNNYRIKRLAKQLYPRNRPDHGSSCPGRQNIYPSNKKDVESL